MWRQHNDVENTFRLDIACHRRRTYLRPSQDDPSGGTVTTSDAPKAAEWRTPIRPWCIRFNMPNIPKKDRRRPWKAKPRNTKPSRSFHSDGTPRRPFDQVPTGSELEPRLKTARWQRFRRAVLQRWPFCPVCDHMGRVTPTTDADHISARHRNEFDMFDIANVWGLCRDCHNVKSQCERDGIHHATTDGWIQHVARLRTRRQ